MSNDTPKAITQPVTWHNESASFSVHPNADAPAAMTIAEVVVIGGVDDSGKRATKRFKASSDGQESVAPNVPKAVNGLLTLLFGTQKHHDVVKALEGFDPNTLFPAVEEDKPASKDDWNDYKEEHEALQNALTGANVAAKDFLEGEASARAGLVSLGRYIASVSETFGNSSKAFNSWLAAGDENLRKAMANRNNKSEMVTVGRLPSAWLDQVGPEAGSAKTINRLWNFGVNTLVEEMCSSIFKGKPVPKSMTAAKLDGLFVEALEVAAAYDEDGNAPSDPNQEQVIAALFFEALPEEGVALCAKGDDASFVAATATDGGYNYGPVISQRAQANELLIAWLKAVNSRTSDAIAASEEEEQKETAKKETIAAVRTFADLGLNAAAMHLARILFGREDFVDVFDALAAAVDTAENGSVGEALESLKEAYDADVAAAAAEADAAAAEAAADDDA